MTGPDAPAFLDTSFVLRYLTDSPPEMAAQAARVIDSEEPLILSELVILEIAYVLGSVYQSSREDIVDALVELIERRNIRLLTLPKSRVLEALELCRPSKRTRSRTLFSGLMPSRREQAGASTPSTGDSLPEGSPL